MLHGVERILADYSKDQSGSAMEGTLTSGGEIWLRDVGSAKSGLVLERWWVDHRTCFRGPSQSVACTSPPFFSSMKVPLYLLFILDASEKKRKKRNTSCHNNNINTSIAFLLIDIRTNKDRQAYKNFQRATFRIILS